MQAFERVGKEEIEVREIAIRKQGSKEARQEENVSL